MKAMTPGLWKAGRFGGLMVAALLLTTSPALAQDNQALTVDGQLISLDADNTPVITVLEILADRSQLNIVTSPEVQGRTISIHLANTPFIEALNLVVRAAGLGYERVGNSILVADPQRLTTQTGLTTRVFDLQYANAKEVTEALAVISKDMSSYGSGNRLIVKAPQSVIEEIDGIIRQLDAKPAQVMLEARLVEVNTTALKQIGIDWEKISNWTQVITEGDPGPSSNDGIAQQLPYIKYGHSTEWYRQVEAFELTLEAMITDGSAKLLANSKITTMNNQPAEIFIGQTVPVVITSLQSGGVQGGAFQSVQLEKIDVGVKLNITPRISDDGFITSLVAPEVSTIVAFVGPNDDLPQTSTRRATSVVRVRDGQKFYLGGLLNEESRETVKKVPLLGDIPVLGYFFRHYRIEKTQTDLLIEVTPTIIHDQR